MIVKNVRSVISGCIIASGREAVLSLHLKTASSNAMASKTSKYHGEISRTSEGGVDLAAEMAKHPDALWIRVKAIEADIPNDNGDCFDREEIVKSYKSFEGCPVFTNHENNKIEAAKGKVILAEWNEEDQSVYCTMFIDREAYPGLCRAIEEGYATDVSMGTQVDYSVCSICHNEARVADQYCEHVKTMKGRTIGGKQVYEKNYGLKFIELSVVTDGACKDCTIREILEPAEAAQAAGMSRAAGAAAGSKRTAGDKAISSISSVKNALINKNAGQDELRKLNEAMTNIEEVAKAMLDQRQYIDLDFLSKVTKVLAELQHVTDELVDQGYGSVGTQPQGQQGVTDMRIPPLSEGQSPEMPSPVATGPTGTGVGAITEPAMAGSASKPITILGKKIKDLREYVEKIYQEARVSGADIVSERNEDTITKLAKIWENPSVRDFRTEVSEGELKVVVGKDEVIGLHNGPKGWEKVASLKIAELDVDVREGIRNRASEFAGHMLDALRTKLAARFPDAAQQHEQTMESQLRDQKGNLDLHPRTNEVRENITEKQLDSKRDSYDKHGRKDEPKHEITEKQLSNEQYDDGLGHQKQSGNPAHEETMERQLRDTSIKGNTAPATSDRPWAAGVDEQHQDITQKQLENWRKADERHLPEHEITEKQLKDQDEPWGRRIASKEDAKMALAAAVRACARTAMATGATPDEILSAIGRMTSEPSHVMVARKIAERVAGASAQRADMLRRSSFHGKRLNASEVDVEDYLLGSLVDAGMTPEVALKAAAYVPQMDGPAEAMAKAMDKESEAIKSASSSKHVDFFKEALCEETEESVRVDIALSEVGEKPENAEAFAKAAFDAARKVASLHGIKASRSVGVEHDGDVVRVSMSGTRMTEEEAKEARKNSVQARKESRKKILAQVPSGGGMPSAPMGGMGGMGGGGGTTLPTPMPGDPSATPPVSSLGEGEIDEEGDEPGEAVPPGTDCPVCHSRDVDTSGGEWQCNDCGADGTLEFVIRIKNYPGVIEEKKPGKGDMGDEAAMEGGFGDMEGGPGMEMPQVGQAASFKVTPEMVKKAGGKPLGSKCPCCRSGKVKLAFKAGSGRGKCETCNCDYKVDTYVRTDEKDSIYARIEWTDMNVEKLASTEVSRLDNPKAAELAKALEENGMDEKFAKADPKGKAAIIADLHDKGMLKFAKCECGCKDECDGSCGCKDCANRASNK